MLFNSIIHFPQLDNQMKHIGLYYSETELRWTCAKQYE